MTTQPTRTLRLLAAALALLAHDLVTHAAEPERNALHCTDVSIWDGRDADASIHHAHELLSRLPRSTQEYLESVAAAFHPERSLSVQQALFREELIWQNRGLTDRQLDLMVFVSVALSLDAAADQAAKLCRSLEEKKDDPSLHKHVANVTQYRSQALTLLAELSPRLMNVADYELRLYF